MYQRPQHLLSRFASSQRVFYIEEPEFGHDVDTIAARVSTEGVHIIVFQLQGFADADDVEARQIALLDDLRRDWQITDYILWYYTPMALPITRHLHPKCIVYDCMDELSGFKFAPVTLTALEQELFTRADVVFTGGHSLYQAKKDKHANIHPFPSSIDKAHFAQARQAMADPADQNAIAHPRLGYYGVIDERFDSDLIAAVAAMRPDWQFVLVGPVVKIDPATLPQAANIHYLGGKSYAELPLYLHGWDIALIPFKRDESTRFISPTKTPEYLSGGKPVISAPINDVINPYGTAGLVHIAQDPDTFIAAAEQELAQTDTHDWLVKVDDFLADNSWDATWRHMAEHINTAAGEMVVPLTQQDNNV